MSLSVWPMSCWGKFANRCCRPRAWLDNVYVDEHKPPITDVLDDLVVVAILIKDTSQKRNSNIKIKQKILLKWFQFFHEKLVNSLESKTKRRIQNSKKIENSVAFDLVISETMTYVWYSLPAIDVGGRTIHRWRVYCTGSVHKLCYRSIVRALWWAPFCWFHCFIVCWFCLKFFVRFILYSFDNM